MAHYPLDILLVEDDECDVLLAKRAFAHAAAQKSFNVVHDGLEALEFLRREPPFQDAPRPDLILLDLNMPRMDGRELLRALKTDPQWQSIPVIVLTTSTADEDVKATYDLHANCYISKPIGLDHYRSIAKAITEFWQLHVTLPRK